MNTSSEATAIIRLRGHGTAPAHLTGSEDPLWRWGVRVVGYGTAWLGGTVLTLVLTFDPFVASFPFVIGLTYTYGAIRNRFRVQAFRGSCPRCGGELSMESGSRIRFPCVMTCFGCHHEPELYPEP